MRMTSRWLAAAILVSAPVVAPTALQAAAPAHGVAMHGEPLYGPNFTHFAYVNPDAPRGGNLTMAGNGTFDSLNPFIIRGTPATGLGLVFETLTQQSNDEPFSEYGLLAETIEIGRAHV